MKIGVLSDTHDRLPTLQRALALFKRLPVGAIFHAGDYVAPFAAKLMSTRVLSIPTYCIYGNNDGEREGLKRVLPNLVDGPLKVSLGGRTIAMHHYRDWFKAEDTADADLVISGHDHLVSIENKEGKLYLNPGECCGWLTEKCTVAVVDLETMKADIIEVHP